MREPTEDPTFLTRICALAMIVRLVCDFHGWQGLLGCASGSTSYPGILRLLGQSPRRRSIHGLIKAAMSKLYVVVQIRVRHVIYNALLWCCEVLQNRLDECPGRLNFLPMGSLTHHIVAKCILVREIHWSDGAIRGSNDISPLMQSWSQHAEKFCFLYFGSASYI